MRISERSIYPDNGNNGRFDVDAAFWLSQRINKNEELSYGSAPIGIEKKLERTQEAIGKLLVILREKNVLTDAEILSVVGVDDWDAKREELKIEPDPVY